MNNENQKKCFDKMALNVISNLESYPEVIVDFQTPPAPVMSHETIIFEKRNSSIRLPDDIKSFYCHLNGFKIQWKVEIGGKPVVIGDLGINRLDELQQITPDGFFVTDFLQHRAVGREELQILTGFILDSSEVGNIVLLYKRKPGLCDGRENDSEIWLQDQSNYWHFISSTFTQYMRLMVVHFGIIGWQMAFTSDGLSKTCMQWMNLYCKERLITDLAAHNADGH